ncbi:MAG: tautomerase family protein [Synergistaceae bacterium]|nr:tautomerase family protein [Synergistaceae bacterium]
MVTLPFIHIHALAGRTAEQKQKLVADITKVICEDFDVTPDHVWIRIDEMQPEHFSTGVVLKSQPAPAKPRKPGRPRKTAK